MKPIDLKVLLALCGCSPELPGWLERGDIDIKLSPVVAVVELEGEKRIRLDIEIEQKGTK